jgi:hypothetical protein
MNIDIINWHETLEGQSSHPTLAPKGAMSAEEGTKVHAPMPFGVVSIPNAERTSQGRTQLETGLSSHRRDQEGPNSLVRPRKIALVAGILEKSCESPTHKIYQRELPGFVQSPLRSEQAMRQPTMWIQSHKFSGSQSSCPLPPSCQFTMNMLFGLASTSKVP